MLPSPLNDALNVSTKARTGSIIYMANIAPDLTVVNTSGKHLLNKSLSTSR
jgi:hypothetical protein